MQRGFNTQRGIGELRARSPGCPMPKVAGASANRTPVELFRRWLRRAASVTAWIACAAARPACGHVETRAAPTPGSAAGVYQDDDSLIARETMVREQIAPRGVKNPAVLAAMGRVPRHEFVPGGVRFLAYDDRPLPIGLGQTISQPYIVALMTDLAAVGRNSHVLEIGTGSGYQAAVLAELGADVYSIEILAPLRERAVDILSRLGYRQVKTRVGDGYLGWPEAAPFDAIIVTAAPARVPEPLKQQLKVGGRLVLPVGKSDQELKVITRTTSGFSERDVIPVRFVPMTGKAGEPSR
jgi:protein-L-isoaspartate(D-aspartate) O-methyltransferase